MIKIEKHDPFYKDIDLKISDDENGLHITIGRDSYGLYGTDKGQLKSSFNVLDRRTLTFRPMSSDDLDTVASILKGNGYGENRLSAIHADFIEFSEKKKLPILVEHDGNVVGLNFHTTVHGRDYLVQIGKSGGVCVTDKAELLKSMATTFSGISRSTGPGELLTASDATVRQLLEDAIAIARKYNQASHVEAIPRFMKAHDELMATRPVGGNDIGGLYRRRCV